MAVITGGLTSRRVEGVVPGVGVKNLPKRVQEILWYGFLYLPLFSEPVLQNNVHIYYEGKKEALQPAEEANLLEGRIRKLPFPVGLLPRAPDISTEHQFLSSP